MNGLYKMFIRQCVLRHKGRIAGYVLFFAAAMLAAYMTIGITKIADSTAKSNLNDDKFCTVSAIYDGNETNEKAIESLVKTIPGIKNYEATAPTRYTVVFKSYADFTKGRDVLTDKGFSMNIDFKNQQVTDTLSGMRGISFILVAGIIAVIIIVLLLFMFKAITDGTYQIALYKALGFTKHKVRVFMALEYFVSALLGGVIFAALALIDDIFVMPAVAVSILGDIAKEEILAFDFATFFSLFGGLFVIIILSVLILSGRINHIQTSVLLKEKA